MSPLQYPVSLFWALFSVSFFCLSSLEPKLYCLISSLSSGYQLGAVSTPRENWRSPLLCLGQGCAVCIYPLDAGMLLGTCQYTGQPYNKECSGPECGCLGRETLSYSKSCCVVCWSDSYTPRNTFMHSFLRVALAILGSLYFCINVTVRFASSMKTRPGLDCGCVASVPREHQPLSGAGRPHVQ